MSTPPKVPSPTPEEILAEGLGFMRSRALLSAVEVGVFTALGDRAVRGDELAVELGLSPRANPDFFDILVAIGMLEREGRDVYRNTAGSAAYLDKNSPEYVGGLLEMSAVRLYPFWGDLTEGLKTGQPQNEIKTTGAPLFAELYSNPEGLEGFMAAMRGASRSNFVAFAERFDFSPYRTLCDVGGATALLSTLVAEQHPHMTCQSVDLPPVEPIASRYVNEAGLSDRVTLSCIDFFEDPIPEADVVTMGMILHDWNLEKKRMLIRKAFDAVKPGGAFVAIEHLIDDDRRENVYGLSISLNMLIEFGDAFDYTGEDFAGWAREAGFARTEVIPLTAHASAAVAYK